MMDPGRGVEVVEGGTRLTVPRTGHARGPKARGGPFYNPAMRLARDVSVALAAVAAAREGPVVTVLDAMAAVGARGLRLAAEVPGLRVTLCDVDAAACAWIRRNAEGLGLGDVEVVEGPFESVVASRRFDWVDVDPYGTPAPFVDAAVRGVRRGGLLAVTATDTATLVGVWPEACRRRYDARPLKAPFGHEVGLRILAGAVVRTAARHDRAARPVLSHATDHYLRVVLRVEDGARRADAALASMGYTWWRDGKDRGVAARRPEDAAWAGPLWTGPLVASEWAEATLAMARRRGMARDTVRLLERLAEEAEGPALFTTMAELGRAGRGSLPRLERLVESLGAAGFVATRTHIDPAAVRTDAPWADLLAASVRAAGSA